MIGIIKWAFRYLKGYCEKHPNCTTCRFTDEEGYCLFQQDKCPCDWEYPEVREEKR